MAVTYEYYSQAYGGGLSEAAFSDNVGVAEAHVRWLCANRCVRTDSRAYKRAVCAAADAFAEFGAGQIGGLAEAVQPKVSYEIDVAALDGGDCELGDTVAVIDTSRSPEWRLKARVVRHVRETDGFVPSASSGASVRKLGAGGVLTDPNADGRHWFWAHYCADGEGVLTASSVPESGRTLVASGRICADAKYIGVGFTPWDGTIGPTHRSHLTGVRFAADMVGYSYLNLNYLLYSATNVASVTGLGNLSGVRSMRYTFASIAATSLDFRGFDPSTLTDLFYCFSGCSSLVTTYAGSLGRCRRPGSRGRSASTTAARSCAGTARRGLPGTRRTRTCASMRRGRPGT